jgi:hypothetical protein
MRTNKIALVVVVSAGIAFAADPWAGTWKLRKGPDNRLADRTITERETGPDTFRVAFDDVSKTGEKTHYDETLVCNGKEHPGVAGELVICKRTGPTTRTLAGKKDGKIEDQVTHSISADGKVLTVTNSSTGKATVYDKQ